jgi:RimJ/RimL family protein N-acetyltransferase
MNWPCVDVEKIEGKYVSVARLQPESDIDGLYEISSGTSECDRLWTYMFYGPFSEKPAMLTWLNSISTSQDPIFYTVSSKQSGKKLGMFSLLNISQEMGRIELGNIWYGPSAQKSRVNTETTYLFLDYLFSNLKYRRVEWKCDNLNEPSKRAALRMGFKYEGLFRQHMMVKNKNRDTAWFSMIDCEWPAIKEKFERYLASDNLSLSKLNLKP